MRWQGALALIVATGCAGTPRRAPTTALVVPPPPPGSDAGETPPRVRARTHDERCVKDDTPEGVERAAAARARGTVALRDRRFEEALSAFRESFAGSCTNATLFLMAVCLERLDELDAARELIDDYAHSEQSAIGHRRATSYRACIERRRRNPAIDCLAEELANVP
ncbi:MAG: hypothetical protein IPM35_22305 [Myxococcales bacterium]|nr:hypothetical protein [Myxococcales bacterium]